MRILDRASIKEKPDKARAVIIDGMGKVAITDYAGCLMFPGGKLDANEDSNTAVKREVQEELGIELDEGKKLFTFQFEAENYPEQGGKVVAKKLIETDYFEFRLPVIEEGERTLTENEKIGKLALQVVDLNDLPEIIESHETTNHRWPFFKQEISIVAEHLLRQEDDSE